MATLTTINDITKPLDTSKWFPANRNKAAMKKDKLAVVEALRNNLDKTPSPADMDIDQTIQESMPWKEVNHKKDASKLEKAESHSVNPPSVKSSRDEVNKMKNPTPIDSTIDSAMKKVRMTIKIRVPNDSSSFSPAKLHIDTLHEIHKFDDSLIIFNADGDERINIEASISEKKYKEHFKPVEKHIGRGPSTISISHDIYLTSKASECEEAIFPFLKRNKIFMYFNPKPGLEHFTSIGVLFGPNPDHTWRDSLADLLIETMTAEITDDESQKIGTTADGKPKIILSLNIQSVGITKPVETTSVVLEIRVPSGLERVYTSIIKRLYEKAENEEIIIPTKLGKFFPYYLKSKVPEIFNYLMRQQNAEMTSTTVIPIFGYTPEARQQTIDLDGEKTTVELAMATTKDIIRIEATPSTWNLHKYLVIVKNENKEAVQKTIRKIFGKIQDPLENQPANFPTPRCGGRENSEAVITEQETTTPTMNAYMIRLETFALAHKPQDAGPAAPPKRHRKFTISYASAAKAGILKQTNKNAGINKSLSDSETIASTQDSTNSSTSQRQVSWDDNTTEANRSMWSSLSRSVTNSKILNIKKDFETEIKSIKSDMEQRFIKQEQQLQEIQKSINKNNADMEARIAQAVITAMIKEKSKVQELTHGRTYEVNEAPLADENGRLPYGPTAQSGGPLDRLHHVEVTVNQMSIVLDTIAAHLQQDPAAKHLFKDDSEDSTILENSDNDENNTDNDITMMLREHSGAKRLHGTDRSPTRNFRQTTIVNLENESPQRSPPPKRERSDHFKPPAKPDGTAREREAP
jgi:hypothetical protein